ncbi:MULTISPECIES: hypothetical protein [Marinobacterium]|uniref:Uncharacterized protein n=2 Tax=Marinobacterium TaxID=48075 RepID=A0A1H5VZJ9_9GAMM|nr:MULTISPECIES: hypothetical protein [Marinobacterium]TCK09062.1 hypothetical protein CLV83_1161 [Marinobacterium mangrovicola]SEF92291.1 hypothetical protein SAMN05444390_101887 [Marinobacterium lutimaris]
MPDIDKYTLVSFAPSLAIVAAMIIGTFVAVRALKKVIAKDAAKAGE